jgi:peptide deformylase
MSVREILRMGDPRLRRVAEPVQEVPSDELRCLLVDMRETMVAANGAGLAAPQIGVNLQVVIFGTGQVSPRYPQELPIPPTVLINPVIEPLDAHETLGWEGCLSVPGLRGQVPRWTRVRYRGLDEQGQPIDRVVDGFHARVVQHECDHLLGLLYPQRMRDFSQFGYTDILFPELAAAKGDDD